MFLPPLDKDTVFFVVSYVSSTLRLAHLARNFQSRQICRLARPAFVLLLVSVASVGSLDRSSVGYVFSTSCLDRRSVMFSPPPALSAWIPISPNLRCAWTHPYFPPPVYTLMSCSSTLGCYTLLRSTLLRSPRSSDLHAVEISTAVEISRAVEISKSFLSRQPRPTLSTLHYALYFP